MGLGGKVINRAKPQLNRRKRLQRATPHSMRTDTMNELCISEGRKDFESLQREGRMFEERGLS